VAICLQYRRTPACRQAGLGYTAMGIRIAELATFFQLSGIFASDEYFF